jgi:hypothetical protein
MNKWISIKDRLPAHHEIILVCSKKGIGVATFVDSNKMNEELWKNGYGNEAVNVEKHPYYFVSQEVKQHTFNNVEYWMVLPEKPIFK